MPGIVACHVPLSFGEGERALGERELRHSRAEGRILYWRSTLDQVTESVVTVVLLRMDVDGHDEIVEVFHQSTRTGSREYYGESDLSRWRVHIILSVHLVSHNNCSEDTINSALPSQNDCARQQRPFE